MIGVVEHLDYLVSLGVTAIYFTPIFQSASNHRYHTHDYEKVDPMLGGTPALRRLIDEAHAAAFASSWTGYSTTPAEASFQFHDILENGPNSAYLDWFTVKEFPLHAYDPDEAAKLSSLVGLACTSQVQHQLPRGSRVSLGNRPQVDRIRNRRLAARRAQRN